ncbi:MAG TPA: SprT-like domain-containing protein [Rhodothermales bacterium]
MQSLGEQELRRPLQHLGWRFEFDRARRRLGSCRWPRRGLGPKVITVSAPFTRLLGLDYRDAQGLQVIDDVIRHEIAHAIDFETRGRSDHGPAWKAICRRVGADPTRLYEDPLADMLLPGKYLLRCPGCGSEVTYYRRPSVPRACRECCRRHSGGRYDERFRLKLVQH